MKLAFSTNAYKKTSLEQAIDSIASLGYAGVELMADVPHAYPPEMPPERIAEVRGRMTARGLAISNINAFTLFAQGDTYHPTWIEKEAGAVRKRVEHTQNVIRMAAALGAKTISLQPGGPLGHGDRDASLAQYTTGLRECLPLAAEHGILLLVEPEPGLLIQRSDECVAFLQQVDHPHLRMNADLGHFYCVGEDPASVIRTCRDWIGHIHLEDIQENRVHQHRVPGEGAMDWPGIAQALRDIDYKGWLTAELYPYESTAEEAARKAFQFLQPLLA